MSHRVLSSTALCLTLALAAAAPRARAQPPAPALAFEDGRASRAAERCVRRLSALPEFGPSARERRIELTARTCEDAAEREPGAAADALLAYLTAMRAWAAGSSEAAAGEADARRELDRALRALPLHIDTTWSGPRDSARIERELASLRRAVDALAPRLASASAPPPTLASLRLSFVHEAGTVEGRLGRLDQQLTGRVAPAPVFHQGQVLAARLAAGAALLPDAPEVAAAARRAERWVARVGSVDGAERAHRAAAAERAAATRFPAPATRDPALERRMRQVFEAQGWNEPVLALALTEAGWTPSRGPDGTVVDRRRDAAIAVRLSDGTCRVYDITFLEPRAGGGWGPMRRSSHSSEPIACDALPRR